MLSDTIMKGVFYAPRSSSHREVELEVGNDKLLLKDPNDLSFREYVPIANTRLSPPLGNVPRELYLTNGGKIVLPANLNYSLLESKQNKHPFKFINKIEQKPLAWLMSLTLIPIAFAFITMYLIPAFASFAVSYIPENVKYQIDEQSMMTMDKIILEPSNLSPEKQIVLTEKWNKLLPLVKAKHNNYRLLFRTGIGANAFALPGGTVVLTDELVELLADKPDAIMAVLLHEIGHVEYNHGLQLAAESIATSVLLTYFLGDIEGAAEYISGGALTIIQNGFSREFEREADYFATKNLRVAGLKSNSFATAIQQLSETHPQKGTLLEKYLSTHPLAEERIQNSLKSQ